MDRGRAAAALLLALMSGACGADDSRAASGPLPVITPAEAWHDRPTAEVSGPLTLREGCLLLDEQIVFWLHGTRWDETGQAVRFEDADPVHVGDDFEGGGGYWDLGGDVSGPLDVESWLGPDAGEAIRSCSRSTGVTALVLAHPAATPG